MSITLNQLPDLTSCMIEGQTLADNIRKLLDDMPYDRRIHRMLNEVCNIMDSTMTLIDAEHERLTLEKQRKG